MERQRKSGCQRWSLRRWRACVVLLAPLAILAAAAMGQGAGNDKREGDRAAAGIRPWPSALGVRPVPLHAAPGFQAVSEEPDWLASRPPAPLGPAASPPDAHTHGPGGPRIFIHVSSQSGAAGRVAQAAARAFVEDGQSVADRRWVDFAIGQPRVRYFFAADRAAAKRTAAVFAAWLTSNGRGATVSIEDFSHYRPLPAPGNIEVWLPSGGWQAQDRASQ